HFPVLHSLPTRRSSDLDCKVKRLVVKPGGILSLQRHQYRSEHWTVISGQATVRLGDDERVYAPNEAVEIPVGTLHRLENHGTERSEEHTSELQSRFDLV